MTNVLIQSLCVLLLVCASCTGDINTNTTEEENTHSHEQANTVLTGPLPTPEVMTENYQTVVLKGDIPSPQKRTSGTIDGTNISITYGSPAIRGRTIWGGLEPYGEVWRTGANEATIFEIAADMKIQGKTLSAGKYALFTIPTKQKWSVIFNKIYDQWGAFEYDENQDALRVETKPTKLAEQKENLEFIIDGNTIAMQWDDVYLPFQATK